MKRLTNGLRAAKGDDLPWDGVLLGKATTGYEVADGKFARTRKMAALNTTRVAMPNSEICESWGPVEMREETRIKAGWSAWDRVALPIKQAAGHAQTARADEQYYATGARRTEEAYVMRDDCFVRFQAAAFNQMGESFAERVRLGKVGVLSAR